MLPGLEIAAAGLLWMASGTVECRVPKAPEINVTPTTQPIAYDYSLSREELGRMGSQSINPYAPGTDTATGGLRKDRPEISLEVSIGHAEHPNGIICLWYDSINYKIALQPKIYIAREYPQGRCRDAILEHERMHVQVDREVINKYAQIIGQTIANAVNQAGALGPYPTTSLEEKQTMMVQHVETAANANKLLLQSEMRRRQAEVDSLEEYNRINEICRREGF